MKIIIANITILALPLICYFPGSGQDIDSTYINRSDRYKSKTVKKAEILIGLNFQTGDYNDSKETRRYFELGIARSVHLYTYHGPTSIGLYISEEVYFGEKNIYGTKISAYTRYMFDIGFAVVYYTDLNKGNFKLRPEFGVGMGALRIVGGYNIPTFGNKAFGELRKSTGQLTIQFLIPVKKKIINPEGSIIKHLFKN